MDSAKVNIAPPMTKAKWFKLVGVPLGNATELCPHGDEVQTVETWSPPSAGEGLDIGTLNRILDAIDAGMADGERYSDHSAAGTRAAWKAVRIHAPDKTEPQCREVIRLWAKNGVLVRDEYYSDADRKKRGGLRVNNAKPPERRRADEAKNRNMACAFRPVSKAPLERPTHLVFLRSGLMMPAA